MVKVQTNALAGVDKRFEMTVADGVLTIEHNPEGEVETVNGIDHKGIAQRSQETQH